MLNPFVSIASIKRGSTRGAGNTGAFFYMGNENKIMLYN